MIVIFAGGLCHGASWNFVIWGVLYGAYLMINHSWVALASSVNLGYVKRLVQLLSWPITFFVVVFAYVVFRAESIKAAMVFYRAMLGFGGVTLPIEFSGVVASLGIESSIRLFAENSRYDFYLGLI